jgi:hypothetical protein
VDKVVSVTGVCISVCREVVEGLRKITAKQCADRADTRMLIVGSGSAKNSLHVVSCKFA